MPTYREDPDLRAVASGLIAKHYPLLKHVKIAYLFRDEVAVSNGKAIAGRMIKCDDMNKALHAHDVVIEIAGPIWADATSQFREALMDHELMHIGLKVDGQGELERKENGAPRIYNRMHDVEEFNEVLERHMQWNAQLRDFLAGYVVKQKQKVLVKTT